jgi:hypothetical protein
MSKSNATENDVLKANLKGTDPSWRANANRYLAYYTADPGEAGTATTNETAYTNYARAAVPIADWTDGGSTFTNTNTIQFPQCGASGATLTHVGIVTTASGAGQILYSGELDDPIAVSNLIRPQFEAGALAVQED